jgi:hypothetical protein
MDDRPFRELLVWPMMAIVKVLKVSLANDPDIEFD